jgi:hypothetical protein
MKPRIRLRFGVWVCVTPEPFVCGCGYAPKGAFKEWQRIQAGLPWEPEVKAPLVPPDPRVLCEEAASERE